MTKEQFMQKHNLTVGDFKNLQRYEKMRLDGSYNMFEYLGMMRKYNMNGGDKIADWIMTDDNYAVFLSVIENKEKKAWKMPFSCCY